jgi:hypothetical protein
MSSETIKKKPKKTRKTIKLKLIPQKEDMQNELENEYSELIKNHLPRPVEFNDFDIKKEGFEVITNTNNDDFKYLYPNINDPDFNIKIAERKEFYDTKYNGEIKDVSEEAEILCNAEFELSPHQLFVRNFLSFQTPYNSLLLYHGLGTGKTCSAITVAEEMRDYLKNIGLQQKIIVVASPNVQENFKLQLFPDNKLKEVDGLWTIKSCTGNKFLKEINPMNMKGLTKDKIISQINQIINTSYSFLGYIEFANLIHKIANVEGDMDEKKKLIISKNKLKKYFNNQLIIIDEVHNIRITEDNKDKRVAGELFKLVESVDNLRLLLLSATPMYNSYKEIIWLINLMNLNDKRPPIDIKDVFNSEGGFKTDSSGKEIGKELLERKSVGYISFLKGEDPYRFPYRIWPSTFSINHSIKSDKFIYPRMQFNNKPVIQPLELIDLYIEPLGEYQQKGYDYILSKLKKDTSTNSDKSSISDSDDSTPTFENIERVGYTLLQKSIQSLNIVYPDERLESWSSDLDSRGQIQIDSKDIIGSSGMNRIMKYVETTSPPSKHDFEYKNDKYGRIFTPTEIGKYSSKIKSICDSIINSKGIILIFSEYIDGGLVPISLALEELGFTKYGTRSLFKTPPSPQIDALQFKTRSNMIDNERERQEEKEGNPKNKIKFNPAKYAMITGDKMYSPDNLSDIKTITSSDNINGEKVKVVLISLAGAEGIDFKNIRQVHILEPWYNMNRIEQIIGRAIRNCSHKELPFKERNVQVYLYGSLLEDKNKEAIDLYIYRLAELKSIQIGRVSRILKENAVDCILNYEQQNFTVEKMGQIVKQHLSNGKTIDYPVGDKPFSSICDYMEKCQYTCKNSRAIGEPKLDTFDEAFIFMNSDKIIFRIKQLYKEKHFYNKTELISRINNIKEYPVVQINAALNQLVMDKHEYISDEYGRLGNLVNIDNLYLFQPIELKNPNISVYDRTVPIQYKHEKVVFKLPDNVDEAIIHKKEKILNVDDELYSLITLIENNFNISTTQQVIKKGEENWFIICSSVIDKMVSEGNSREKLIKCLIEHILELLNFEHTILILNYLYDTTTVESELSDITRMIKSYYDNKIMTFRRSKGLLVLKDGKQQLIVQDNTTFKWNIAEGEDYNDFSSEIKNMISRILPINNVLGFIGMFKTDYLIFKVKTMDIKRNKGARCDQAGKIETIKTLNRIYEEERYSKENTKGIGQIELCIRQELSLRLFNIDKKNNKRWFLTPVEAVLINIEKMTLNK